MRVALVYDRVNKFGGAERVLSTLHEIWPDAPLFSSVYDSQGASWADGWDIRTSFLQRFSGAKNCHEAFGWLMPLVFESFDLSEFDVVISVTSEAAKGVITSPRQLHVCYMLTPTRYLWSHQQEYLKSVPLTLKPLARIIQAKLRIWDFVAAQRPDYFIAISKLVQKRCLKYYRREAEVIYPPLSLDLKRSDLTTQGQTLSERGYFLIVSRLVPYKRVDLAIEACNRLKFPLIIVGNGSDQRFLKQMAGPTVKFMGHLTDEELVGYYRNSRAVIMPQEEDFGLTAIEGLSLGVPVISYKYSGAAEVVEDGKTGILFAEQTVDSLVGAIKRFLEVVKFVLRSRVPLRRTGLNANRFSKVCFKKVFKSKIELLWQKHR